MPSTSKKILEQLGGGHVTDKPEILFQRLDLEEVMKKVEELHPAAPAEAEEKEENVIDIEPKEEISFEQFGTMQFQVGEIIACEEVKKSKKLLCSQVKIGSQVKQIVSGIKAHYTPEEMVGKKVMVLVNLNRLNWRECFPKECSSVRRCRWKSVTYGSGKRNAGRCRNLLDLSD